MGWGDTLFYLISLIRLIFRGGGFAASVASLTLGIIFYLTAKRARRSM